ncbi:MAG: Lrp/AsnC family transcriptional regulator [Candidatus Pacearchaeota archaeon]
MKKPINESEKRILNTLIKDSRKSYRELAKESKVSVATISNKLKEFKNNGILKAYTTLVDYDLLGYEVHVIINIRVSQGQEVVVGKKLFNSPNVTAIYDLTGEFDIMVIARFKNRRELDNYLKTVQAYEFVERTQTQLILSSVKEMPIIIS